ncbi:QRFP-like peptide receptor [Uloborus diversus]|uniref:QRFP-like peptide receptor n=1 Tax=Uloborus diversus TaxID=327109 RepID=UPI00240A9456|nr:QRFP-like peptide receptor [Uloborus diversus]
MADNSCGEYDNSNDTSDDDFSALLNITYPGNPAIFKTLDFSDYMKIFAYVLIIIGGLLGNISVILTVALNRSMRTTINFYVANLAVADAMICIFCMGPHILSTLTYPLFVLGEFMCKFNPFMQMTCLTNSVLTLSAISCDRFMAIMFPLHVRITKQRTSVVMKVIWVISIIVSIPFLIVKKHLTIQWKDFLEPQCSEMWSLQYYYDDETEQCIKYEPLRTIYYVVVSVTLFFLPVAIMITAYSLILWKLWISEVPGERHIQNINVQYRARKKVIKMVFVVLVAFICCWMPLQVMVLYSIYGHNPNEYGQLPAWFPDFKWFSYYIAYANSFMNPIIYGGFNKTFREGFCIVLRCGFQRDRFIRPLRTRLTFTSGVNSTPTRITSKTLNGPDKVSFHRSSTTEMRAFNQPGFKDHFPDTKESFVIIKDTKNSPPLT